MGREREWHELFELKTLAHNLSLSSYLGVFYDLCHLSHLDTSDNEISYISCEVFYVLNNLKYLEIGENSITPIRRH